MIEKAQIEELKKKHGEIYEGEIRFSDSENNTRSVEFIFRRPKTSDVEAYAKNAQTVGFVTGNLNLLQSLVVYPEPASVVESVREFPNAYGKFVETVVQPFFGSAVEARGRKL
jgi:hypothetical protein